MNFTFILADKIASFYYDCDTYDFKDSYHEFSDAVIDIMDTLNKSPYSLIETLNEIIKETEIQSEISKAILLIVAIKTYIRLKALLECK